VTSLPAPSRSVFDVDWRAPARPLVLRGVARDIVARRRWTPEALREDFGGFAIPVALIGASGQVNVDPRRGVVREPRRLAEFLERLRSDAPIGYLTARFEELPPALHAELETPTYARGEPWLVAKLWISHEGTVSALHWDLADNLHVQLCGRKRFSLVSPAESASVYPAGLLSSIPNGSLVNLDAPDLARFPRLASAELHVAELEPGDGLYIPRRWWHHVRTVEVSISANWFFASGANAAVALAADLAKRVRGISR
jgi:lysine-specific demethylase 8